MHEDNPHRMRRHVKLPGGRQIEVVYLDGAPEHNNEISAQLTRPATSASADQTSTRASSGAPIDPRMTPDATNTPVEPRPVRASSDTPVTARPWSGDSPSTAPGEALHVCSRCAGGLVHPLDWVEESPGRWRILMRCPDCDALREGVFGQALVERLDEELDRATGALLSDLRQLTHANMVEEIEVFSRALELDLIGPNDFQLQQ
jgi:hypothetical protein